MPRVRITHATEYIYARPVRFTPHRLMLRPRDSHDLRLLNATLALTPTAKLRWAHDVFGNSIGLLEFGEARADRLSIVSTLDLEHFPAVASDAQATLDPAAETYPFSYAPAEAPDLARLCERHHADPDRLVDSWAHRFLQLGRPTGTMALLTSMTRAIKAEFRYQARDAEGTNEPTATLATRSGSCRDFALLMMEAVRALGLAARFVSGYLYDEGRTAMVGGGATHAWCSVYLPGAGWVDFDPTNGLVAGRNLIRVSVARTPEQAVPVAGGFIGGQDDFIGMRVDVRVAVGAPA